jgi:alanyl-tRNA synthetase
MLRKFLEESAEMRNRLEEYVKEKTIRIKNTLIDKKQNINDIDVFVLNEHIPADVVKDLAFQLKGQFPEKSAFVGVTDADNKPLLTLMLSDDLVKERGLNASQIVRDAAKHIQGGGGGQPHFATAGGKNAEGLPDALHEILEKIKKCM